MLVLAGFLLLISLAGTAAAEEPVVFGGGTYATASELATALNDISPNTALASGNTLTLQKDLNLTGTVTLTGEMTLLGADHTIWRGGPSFYLFNVTKNGNLTLGDGRSALTIHGQNDLFVSSTMNHLSLISITGNDARLLINDRVTLKNSTLHVYQGNPNQNGGAITLSNGADLTIAGGEISGNSVPGARGSAIYVTDDCTLLMTGGTISGNSGGWGSVEIGGTDSTLTISGGRISENDCSGVRISGSNGTLLMTGGEISGNTKSGIYQAGSNTLVQISGGRISGNIATTSGGGIESNYGSLVISGGEIFGNTAPFSGGGISAGGTVLISGGKIIGNTVSGNNGKGGGISNAGGNITLTGGEISGNTAVNGGGISIVGTFGPPKTAVMSISGGTITRNTATGNGGGIYVDYKCEFEMHSGDISGNTATGSGGGVYMNNGADGKVTLTGGSFSRNTDSTGGNGFSLLGGDYLNISGTISFDQDNSFRLSGIPKNTIIIPARYDGAIQTFSIDEENLDETVLFTILPSSGQKASAVIKKLGLADTARWILEADDSANTIKSVLNKPKVAAGSAQITWINATAANVSIRLDPAAGNATEITANLTSGGSSIKSSPLTGSFVKGSTIQNIQVTGLQAGTTYSLTIELKNTGISTKTFPYTNLASTTSPTPASVTITGEGGAALQDPVVLSQSHAMIFGVLVYDSGGNLLVDEPVTWTKTGSYTTKSADTPTKVTVSAGSTGGTDTLTATADHGGVSGSVSIEIVTTQPSLLAISAERSVIGLGDTVRIVPNATDANGKSFVGYDVAWTVSPRGNIANSKTGSAIGFTPTSAGTYTISASIATPSLTSSSVTLTVIGTPAVTTQPQGASYLLGQTAAALTVAAAAPAGGTGALAYAWEKSPDSSFLSNVTSVGTGTSCTPDISQVGIVYYRANVTYTESGFVTRTLSSIVPISVTAPPIADLITISKTGDGTRTVTLTTMVRNVTSGEMPNVQINWEISDGAENISLQTTGQTAIVTGKKNGVASVKASVAGTPAVNNTISFTVAKSDPVPTPIPTSSGGEGYSSSSSGSIGADGQVSFGTGTGVTGISFAKDTKGTVVLETKPEGVSAPAKAHAVVDISAPSFEGSAEISFSVPLAVLRDQGLGTNDVVMQHYVNGQWVKIPTFFVGEDRGAAKYVAQTTSFSPFAIVYEKSGAQTVERSTPQPTKDSGSSAVTAKPTASQTSGTASATAAPVTSAATDGATAVPTMTQAPVPVAGVLLGLLAACGVLIRRRE